MPIEIRELVIKATVAQEDGAASAPSSARASDINDSPTEALINTCVEKVLEILKERNGR
ncbi:DUF5908 family protein [Pontibacter pamirensis]|uniref:DUF5908 family protein n=1 Tax=Pontibacter pamirensis TaxID=2562824 RepID=UPI00192E4C77|nr:DUF5908 family protein [Pontibacter pamirensis]